MSPCACARKQGIDHGAPIEGSQVPFLDQAKELAIAAVRAFPEMRFAGLDIAIAENGPVIIELNVNPDRKGATFVDVPTGDILPDF